MLYESILQAIAIVAVLMDILLIGVLGYFMKGLSWETEGDRSSIIGFGWMMGVVILNVVVAIFGI
jgi:hypothetical protein